MDFSEAEQRFSSLKQRLTVKQITAEEFSTQTALLRLQDSSGSWWQLGEDGRWFFWNGASWELRVPPVVKPPVVPPSLSGVQPQKGTQETPGGKAAPKTLVQLIALLIPAVIKAWFKNIPLMIVMSIVIFVVHTFSVVYLNEGFSRDSSHPLLSMGLVLRGNFLPGILFWTFLTAIGTSLMMQIVHSGFSKVKSDISMVPSWVRESLNGSGAASMSIVLGCAAASLFMGSVLNNRLVSLQLCVMMTLSLMSQQKGLMAVVMPLAWSDARRMFNRPQGTAFNPAWVGASLMGTLVGFGSAVILPFAPYLGVIGAIVLGGVAVKMFLDQNNRPSGGVMMFLPFMTLFFAWLAKEAFADDGGWRESGATLEGWLKSSGATTAVGIGVPPTVAANVGVAAGVATGSDLDVTVPSGETPTEEDEDKKQWINQRQQDLKNALEQKAFIEAAKKGYGDAGFDVSEHNRQISDLDSRIADLKNQLEKEGAGLDYTPASRDPIGPGKEFQEVIQQEKEQKEAMELINQQLEQEKAAVKEQAAKEQEHLVEEMQKANNEVNSATGVATDIVIETIEDGSELIKEGATDIVGAAKDVIQNPDIIIETLDGAGTDLEKIGSKAWELGGNAVGKTKEVLNDTKDAVDEMIKNPQIFKDTVKGTGSDIVTIGSKGVDIAKDTAREVYDTGKDIVQHPKIYAESVVQTAKTTASDVKDLSTKVGDVIYKHAKDHEKRNDFIKNVSGFKNFANAMDPNKPLDSRLTNYGVGVFKVVTTVSGVAPGTARAVAVTAISKTATHAAATNLEPIIEKAKVLNSTLKAMGIDTGDTKNIGKITEVYKYLKSTGAI